jgi:hypothetical protein
MHAFIRLNNLHIRTPPLFSPSPAPCCLLLSTLIAAAQLLAYYLFEDAWFGPRGCDICGFHRRYRSCAGIPIPEPESHPHDTATPLRDHTAIFRALICIFLFSSSNHHCAPLCLENGTITFNFSTSNFPGTFRVLMAQWIKHSGQF